MTGRFQKLFGKEPAKLEVSFRCCLRARLCAGPSCECDTMWRGYYANLTIGKIYFHDELHSKGNEAAKKHLPQPPLLGVPKNGALLNHTDKSEESAVGGVMPIRERRLTEYITISARRNAPFRAGNRVPELLDGKRKRGRRSLPQCYSFAKSMATFRTSGGRSCPHHSSSRGKTVS